MVKTKGDSFNDNDNFAMKCCLLSPFSISIIYTCQLFLRYKREIFILGVLGFLKTTRSFPKIPEEVQSLPKNSEVFRRRPKSAEGEVIEKTLIHKIRDREEGIVIYSFYTWFSFLTWV